MGLSGKSDTVAARPRKAGWRLNALVTLLSLGLSLLVAEALLRWVGHDHPQWNRLDPVVGWRPRPGVTGWYSGEIDNFIAINQEGYRDIDHPLVKAPGTYRILLLGDSMSEGVEVPFQDLYWKWLESILPECPTFSGRRIEVISLAVNGYGTAQEYLTLRERGLKYRPDLVLLAFFTGNDFTDNVKALGHHRDRPYFVLRDGRLVLEQTAGMAPDFASRQSFDDLKQRLLDPIRIIQLVRQAQARLRMLLRYGRTDPNRIDQPGLDNRVFMPPATPDWEQAWAVTGALVNAIAESAHANGAAFAMTTLTNPFQVLPDAAARQRFAEEMGVPDLSYPDRRLAEFAAASGFPDATLAPVLGAYAAEHHAALHGSDPRQPIGHWNPLGHRLAAEELSRDLCGFMAAGRLAPAPMPPQSGSNTLR
jgi:GDSL-like Lipase/Acylhydrolase family